MLSSAGKVHQAATSDQATKQCEDNVDAHDGNHGPQHDVDDLGYNRDADHAGQERHQ
jgi:hypothetical protein